MGNLQDDYTFVAIDGAYTNRTILAVRVGASICSLEDLSNSIYYDKLNVYINKLQAI